MNSSPAAMALAKSRQKSKEEIAMKNNLYDKCLPNCDEHHSFNGLGGSSNGSHHRSDHS